MKVVITVVKFLKFITASGFITGVKILENVKVMTVVNLKLKNNNYIKSYARNL